MVGGAQLGQLLGLEGAAVAIGIEREDAGGAVVPESLIEVCEDCEGGIRDQLRGRDRGGCSCESCVCRLAATDSKLGR